VPNQIRRQIGIVFQVFKQRIVAAGRM